MIVMRGMLLLLIASVISAQLTSAQQSKEVTICRTGDLPTVRFI